MAPAPSASPIDAPRSGTRLELVVNPGGSDAIGTAWDSELSFRCVARFTFDRRLRCVPDPIEPYLEKVFFDEECTEPLLRSPASWDQPHVSRMALPEEALVIAATSREFHRSEPSHASGPDYVVVGSPEEYRAVAYRREGWSRTGPCVPLVHRHGPSRFWRVLRSLQFSDFEALSAPAALGSDGARLRPRFVAGDDGSRIPYDYWDTVLEIGCRFDQDNFARDRCVPHLPDYEFHQTFADSYCSVPGISVRSRLQRNPTVVPTTRWVPPEIQDGKKVGWQGDGGVRATREYALVGGTAGRVHTAIHGKCNAGTGMIGCPECRSLRIEHMVPVSAFAGRGDVGRVISDEEARAIHTRLLPPPVKSDPIPPVRYPRFDVRVLTSDGTPLGTKVPRDVRQSYGRFRACYEVYDRKQSEKPEEHQGRVVVTATTGARGRVSARVDESTLQHPRAAECIAHQIRTIARPADAEGTVRTYELTFELFPPALPVGAGEP